jgi:hypothetical protein
MIPPRIIPPKCSATHAMRSHMHAPLLCAIPPAPSGPDRSKRRRAEVRGRQNLRFVTVCDRWGRPYVFMQATRAIAAGAECLVDYGDRYWAKWRGDLGGLSQQSKLCRAASAALVLLRGSCAAHPICLLAS